MRWLDPSASASAELDQGFAVSQTREHGGMRLVDGSREHGNVARASRGQRKSLLGGVDVSHWPQSAAQPSDLDAQPRTVRTRRRALPERPAR